MNVGNALITMDPEQAKEKLRAYRAAKHRDAEVQYQEAAQAYAQLAKGVPLLRLTPAIQAGGFFDSMLPKLAIARADRPEVRFQWGSTTEMTFDSDFEWRRGPDRPRCRIVVHASANHGITGTFNDHGKQSTYAKQLQGFALVPMVPADVRPKFGKLIDLHILWEVEHWSATPKTAKAPVDPMLLKHVGGDLYAVLATWDLTPVEQAILEGAMRST